MPDNYISISAEKGNINVSEDVIAVIAGSAIAETEGVAGLSGRATDIRGIISRNDAARAVRVINTENDTILDVYVTLKAGARIQETAMALQQNVKTAVQSMTGKPVTRINVHVDGIVADENKA